MKCLVGENISSTSKLILTRTHVGMALNRESQHKNSPPSLNTLARLYTRSDAANAVLRRTNVPRIVEALLGVLFRSTSTPVLEHAAPPQIDQRE